MKSGSEQEDAQIPHRSDTRSSAIRSRSLSDVDIRMLSGSWRRQNSAGSALSRAVSMKSEMDLATSKAHIATNRRLSRLENVILGSTSIRRQSA